MPLPAPEPPAYSPEDDCAICYESLHIPPKDDKTSSSFTIDDIELKCKHHFHWSCFEEYDRAAPTNRERCPICRGCTLTADGRLFANVRNEGGFTGAIDLGQELDISAFEDSQPESWKKGQALLGLCQCSDFDEAEALLRDGVDPNAAYPDGTTGLHMAADNDSVEWASLLLRYGADKQLRNDFGVTALECARDAQAQRVIELLEQRA